jgi:uracil-DNA glycosylase
MTQLFDPGYGENPFRTLCENYPDSSVYPFADFRVEWGPIFHRGRLDGSARVLIIGQDPSHNENIARRILVGEAGRRTQGFLAKLGVTRSYVLINTFLYSVYGQAGGNRHKDDLGITKYRNLWLDALLVGTKVEVVVALGTLADNAWNAWKKTAPGQKNKAAYAKIIHPTEPESSSGGNKSKLAAATKAMLQTWNAALQQLHPAVAHPDQKVQLVLYGDQFNPEEKPNIPDFDFPAGLPEWMRNQDGWAKRAGKTAPEKRADITITVPATALK